MRKAALTEAQIRKHLADNLSYLRQAKNTEVITKGSCQNLKSSPENHYEL